jgi:hypothetical protein
MADPTNYGAALAAVRAYTGSRSSSPFSLLLRVAAMSPQAARALLDAPLNTRQQRRAAVIAAAETITAAADEREAAE